MTDTDPYVVFKLRQNLKSSAEELLKVLKEIIEEDKFWLRLLNPVEYGRLIMLWGFSTELYAMSMKLVAMKLKDLGYTLTPEEEHLVMFANHVMATNDLKPRFMARDAIKVYNGRPPY